MQRDEEIIMSDFIFVKPSFFNGIARASDTFATFTEYNLSSTGQEADFQALKNDFEAIGGDLQIAIDQFESDYVQG